MYLTYRSARHEGQILRPDMLKLPNMSSFISFSSVYFYYILVKKKDVQLFFFKQQSPCRTLCASRSRQVQPFRGSELTQGLNRRVDVVVVLRRQ